MVERAASPCQPRPLYRLEHGSASPEHPLPCLQHAISDPAVGASGTPCVSYPGPDGFAHLRRLAAGVRASDLVSGNVHRSGALPRHVLSRSELGGAGPDDRTRQAIQQLCAKPFHQGSTRLSTESGVSRLTQAVMKKKGSRSRVDVNVAELDRIIDDGRSAPLSEAGSQKLKTALHALAERF